MHQTLDVRFCIPVLQKSKLRLKVSIYKAMQQMNVESRGPTQHNSEATEVDYNIARVVGLL